MGDARTLANAPMPPRVAALPRNQAGYPIPWFVATLDDGTRDFRIADRERHIDALRLRLCWVCGGRLGANVAFVIGPMCALNRISSEPPAHLACADYSALVCPFLATPQMVRREGGKPDGLLEPAGVALRRNPGVALVWVTRSFRWRRATLGQPGYLCSLGDPVELFWYAHGRVATRAEILASIDSGLPALRDACQHDHDPADSLAMLERDYRRALALVPAA
jgi:hypothetical protein